MQIAWRVLLCVPLFSLSAASASAQIAMQPEWPVRGFPELLDLHHEPQSATDRSGNMFFDQGAWHGYSLPPTSDPGTGFVGPFLSATGAGVWAGKRFASVELIDPDTSKPIGLTACDHGGVALPGSLARQACGKGIKVKETLFYAAASTAIVRVTLEVSRPRTLKVFLTGERTLPADEHLIVRIPDSSAKTPTLLVQNDRSYRINVNQAAHLVPGRASTYYLQQTYLPPGPGMQLPGWSGSPDEAWHRAGERWAGYLKRGGTLRPDLQSDRAARRINAKAIVTLIDNWRAPIGDLRHAGVVPSYSNPDFNSFWAWDSWKHAAALARFAPDLAKDQVRAIFDFQLSNGMVPDLVSRNRKENNLRDTKPPLATWAVAAIYGATHDRAFVDEMFDKLYRYHRWWYENRDHARNGLAEYGATDGTREAAGWESGMDNAVRFDDAVMLKNHDGAWSLNQESVDLNSYLYQEKLELASMATLLGKAGLARQLTQEAARLRTRIQQTFFDPASGYFFDVRLETQKPVHVFGPEGWTPLFTGAATAGQARSVAKVLMDPAKFNTRLPFPTLAADDPHFAPEKGYWRGPVWIDQAVFAIQGLERYGLKPQADAMRQKLLTQADGIAAQGTFRETYNPETGAGQNSQNFSWSAAEYFLLLHANITPQPN